MNRLPSLLAGSLAAALSLAPAVRAQGLDLPASPAPADAKKDAAKKDPATADGKKAAAKPEAKKDAKASDKDSAVPAHQNHPLDTDFPKPTGAMVELKISGDTAQAYVAKPKGEPKGAILVVHEYWGLNDWIKHEADELASLGYLALAVDLYKGQIATDADNATKLMGGLDNAWAARVEHAGIVYLKSKVGAHNLGVIGWCMGGGQALQASLGDPQDVAATVIYYGMPVTEVGELNKLRGDSILGIYAKKDGWITPDKVAAFDAALKDAHVEHELHSYDADHAFANPSGGKHNPEAAKDAWKRTKAFLAAHLN